MYQNYHIGLLTTALGFLDSANKLNDDTQLSGRLLPVYYLYFHCIELALKSFIYFKNKNDSELKEIGHDLKKALETASQLGIQELYPENHELKECIAIGNHMYHEKQLEYYFPGFKRLPELSNVKNACNCLYQALDQKYRPILKSRL